MSIQVIVMGANMDNRHLEVAKLITHEAILLYKLIDVVYIYHAIVPW